jgi:hypothetical protein
MQKRIESIPAEAMKKLSSWHEANERDEIVRILKVTNGRVGGPDGAAARMDIKRTALV